MTTFIWDPNDGLSKVVISTTAPANAGAGYMWIDTSTPGAPAAWLSNGAGGWVSMGGGGGGGAGLPPGMSGVTIGPTAPAAPSTGAVWVDTTTAAAPVAKLYTSGGTWLAVAGMPAGISGITIGTTAPTTPSTGDVWIDTSVPATPIAKLRTGANTWLPVGLPAGMTGISVSATAPATPAVGDVWVDTSTPATPVTKVRTNANTWQTVGALPAGMPVVTRGTTAPTTPAPVLGDIWVDTSTGTDPVVKIRDSGGNWDAWTLNLDMGTF